VIGIWSPGWDPSDPDSSPISFSDGDVIKVTQANGVEPSYKKMGSTNGKAGVVMYHFIVPDDLAVVCMDASWNQSYTFCLVPPPPM